MFMLARLAHIRAMIGARHNVHVVFAQSATVTKLKVKFIIAAVPNTVPPSLRPCLVATLATLES